MEKVSIPGVKQPEKQHAKFTGKVRGKKRRFKFWRFWLTNAVV